MFEKTIEITNRLIFKKKFMYTFIYVIFPKILKSRIKTKRGPFYLAINNICKFLTFSKVYYLKYFCIKSNLINLLTKNSKNLL